MMHLLEMLLPTMSYGNSSSSIQQTQMAVLLYKQNQHDQQQGTTPGAKSIGWIILHPLAILCYNPSINGD